MPMAAARKRIATPAPLPAKKTTPLRVVAKRSRATIAVAPAIAAGDDKARHYAPCRALGHEWRHVGFAAPEVSRPLGEYNAVGYVSTCSHCSMERTKWIGRRGSNVGTTYRPPEGYARHGDERMSTSEWRRTWIVTVLGDDA